MPAEIVYGHCQVSQYQIKISFSGISRGTVAVYRTAQIVYTVAMWHTDPPYTYTRYGVRVLRHRRRYDDNLAHSKNGTQYRHAMMVVLRNKDASRL